MTVSQLGASVAIADEDGNATPAFQQWLQRVLDESNRAQALAAMNAVQSGSIVPYCGDIAPVGWIIPTGQSLKRKDYPALFRALKYRFGGSGDNFSLPDLRGLVLVGAGKNSSNAITNKPLGSFGGEETHVLTTPEMPSHNHALAPQVHYASVQGGGTYTGFINAFAGGLPSETVANTGGGGAHNNLQPYQAVTMIMKL